MKEEHWVLRDEIVNIHAMAKGGLPQNHSHQIFVCKKKPFKKKKGAPFLLDKKETPPKYNLSKLGMWYEDKIKAEDFSLNYVGFIDFQIEISVNFETFKELTEKNFFSIWTPTSPLDYFEKNKTGYLVVFKVFKTKTKINERLLEKGRKGRNSFFRLTEYPIYDLCEPVIETEKYESMKSELLSILKANNSFVSIYKENQP
ncbi:hypothetical protein [Pelobacter seleniigenes]|uniref:hypothetical protein n=1 Tax=Pelobacter seleniigenes TaxID=407188 RepID=UPI0004A752D5|nr:hypothetical protein [Pelobacter seleniigenes]